MLITNVGIVNREGQYQIKINGGRVEGVSTYLDEKQDQPTVYFDDAIAFPGLINSHDHLEFNLFPQLVNEIYPSYIEWAADIHRENKEIINKINKIPERLRISWGLYKNLFNGVTTVVNHGKKLILPNKFITVLQSATSLHSLAGERHWKWKLLNPFKFQQPVVMHIGEGTNEYAGSEIRRFTRWNLFKKKLVAIHGVAMKSAHASAFEALVWCPDSNLSMLGQTAHVQELKKHTAILFGTDSTLTANWNLWEQLRLAAGLQMLTDVELYESLTSAPAAIWRLHQCGKLQTNFHADIVIAKKRGQSGWAAFFSINPEDILLILKNGRVILFDNEILTQLKNTHISLEAYSLVNIGDSMKYVIGDFPSLLAELRKNESSLLFPIGV